ncbi:MAG: hypothetical protein E7668_07350 [Ruminococcaceae bacterium]|nr:hypothetical protein [Oscillospiraceae bacterium]
MEYKNMDEQAVLAAILDGAGRAAAERISELRGVDYCLDKERDTDIRVMTANLLYAKWDKGCDPDMTKYPLRMKRTAECINLYRPDFVGMQEARLMMREPLDPHLDAGYAYVEFDPPKQNAEWFPILYRADRWTVVASGTGEYTECHHPWGYVWATFARKENADDRITVMNLHYTVGHFMSVDPSWIEFHTGLASEINRQIGKQLTESPDTPIAITGDYNTGRDTELYETMIKELPMEDAPLLTENSNMTVEQMRNPWYLDHITVTKELVEVVSHRRLDYYPDRALSDHPFYFTDLRKYEK